jgi:hypothetical protein
MAEDIEEPEEGFEEFEEDFDEDADVDVDIDEDVEVDEDEDDDEEGAPKSKSSGGSKKSKDDFAAELTEKTYDQAVRANPKRLAMVQKRAGLIETILDRSDLSTPEGILKAWDTIVQETNTSVHKPYSVSDNFVENEVVGHPLFGTGFVAQVLSPTKVEILFETGFKRLACNR